jgi:hypothetical protein
LAQNGAPSDFLGLSLVVKVIKAMRSQELTQQEVTKRMGINQQKVLEMRCSNFTNLSERKLMDCLD